MRKWLRIYSSFENKDYNIYLDEVSSFKAECGCADDMSYITIHCDSYCIDIYDYKIIYERDCQDFSGNFWYDVSIYLERNDFLMFLQWFNTIVKYCDVNVNRIDFVASDFMLLENGCFNLSDQFKAPKEHYIIDNYNKSILEWEFGE